MKQTRTGIAMGLCLLACDALAADAALPQIEGRIQSVNPEDRSVVIDCGRAHGVVPKMVFRVYGEAEVLYLPLTGKDVVHISKEVASVQVLDVDERQCRGEVWGADASQVKKNAVVIGFPAPKRASVKPNVSSISIGSDKILPGTRVKITAAAQDPDGDPLTFKWSCTGGRFSCERTVDPAVEWSAPAKPGEYKLTVVAIDADLFESNPKEQPVVVGVYPEDRHKVPFKLSRAVNPAAFFESVSGLAVDRFGGIYVVDSKALLVRKAPPDATSPTFFGQKGSDPGQFREPARAVCFESFLYVVDRSRCTVLKFNLGGNFLKEYGEKGSENGQFAVPEDVAVSPKGDLFVADSEAARVQVFNDQGTFLFSLGRRGVHKGNFQRPVALSIDRAGNLYVLDAAREQLVCFDRDLRFTREIAVGKADDFDIDSVRGVAYFLYSSECAVKKFLLEKGQPDPAFKKVGGAGEGWGQFSHPVAVSCDPFGNFLVADGDSKRRSLQRFSAQGDCLGKRGGEDYSEILRVASAPSGDLFCLSEDGVIRRLDASGWTLSRFGGPDSPGKMKKPVDLVIGPGGGLYVMDRATSQIKKFSLEGAYISDFVQTADAKQLKKLIDTPTDLAFAQDKLFVLDEDSPRVQILGPDGAFQEGIHHEKKVEDRNLSGANRVAVDPVTGKIVVGLGTAFKVYGPDRSFVETWGKKGDQDGQFSRVEEMQFDFAGDLWVLDSRRGVVQRFRFGAQQNPFLSVVRDSTRVKDPTTIACSPFGELWVWDAKTEQAIVFVQE